MTPKEVSPQVEKIRVSVGTAGLLGLVRLHSDAEPTTAYLMTYTRGSCRANCAFCPQARESSSSRELLSRVVWPDFRLRAVIEGLRSRVGEERLRRVCIQALNYPSFAEDVCLIVTAILSETTVPISVSCPPMTKKEMERLKQVGVERIGLPLDCASPELFDGIKGSAVKGPYRWESHFMALKDALEIFGARKVSTHIIVGLGETEREAIEIIQEMHDMGVNPSLFAFTPIKGTKLQGLKRPGIGQYRRLQLARHLIVHGVSTVSSMKFGLEGRITDFGVDSSIKDHLISIGDPFMTAGCPDCNRPFYTESPRGPVYNYPKPLSEYDKKKVIDELTR
jgi:biotin synthase-related radical SAM superfamily protein